MLKTSFFNNLAIKQATEKFFEDKEFIKRLVSQAIEEEKERKAKHNARFDFPEYSLNLTLHTLRNNLKSASDDSGCGCDLCKYRFYYVNAKRNIKWFEKCYLDDNSYGHFMEIYEREVFHTGFSYMPESEFFNYKLADLTTILKSYESLYREFLEKYKKIGLNF